MRLIRWFRCWMDIGHRLEKKWWPKSTAGLSSEVASVLYKCEVNKDGDISYLECRDCHCKMAPFEATLRGWKVSA